MKKLSCSLLFASIILSATGCSTSDLLSIDGNRYFQVFQVIDGGALAYKCDRASGTTCLGMVVFLPTSVDPQMYDEKLIHLKSPQIIDTYTYETRNSSIKTVPVVVDKNAE